MDFQDLSTHQAKIKKQINASFLNTQQEIILTEEAFDKAIESGILTHVELITDIKKARVNPNLIKIIKISEEGKREHFWFDKNDIEKAKHYENVKVTNKNGTTFYQHRLIGSEDISLNAAFQQPNKIVIKEEKKETINNEEKPTKKELRERIKTLTKQISAFKSSERPDELKWFKEELTKKEEELRNYNKIQKAYNVLSEDFDFFDKIEKAKSKKDYGEGKHKELVDVTRNGRMTKRLMTVGRKLEDNKKKFKIDEEGNVIYFNTARGKEKKETKKVSQNKEQKEPKKKEEPKKLKESKEEKELKFKKGDIVKFPSIHGGLVEGTYIEHRDTKRGAFELINFNGKVLYRRMDKLQKVERKPKENTKSKESKKKEQKLLNIEYEGKTYVSNPGESEDDFIQRTLKTVREEKKNKNKESSKLTPELQSVLQKVYSKFRDIKPFERKERTERQKASDESIDTSILKSKDISVNYVKFRQIMSNSREWRRRYENELEHGTTEGKKVALENLPKIEDIIRKGMKIEKTFSELYEKHREKAIKEEERREREEASKKTSKQWQEEAAAKGYGQKAKVFIEGKGSKLGTWTGD